MAVGAISVEDVSKAHILAAEKKEAAGQRYLVSSANAFSRQEFAEILIKSGQFKQFPLTENRFMPPTIRYRYDNTKVQKLGVELSPIPDVIVAMAHSLIKFGIVSGPRSKLQIGRAVQQECRDRSRMPSSA
eukprot:TRINITY_DN28529_c0_g1_i6.p1 TRINITY_DN28529_c0_g1~~TRINITY_DN28529_c0_g1_i6.p1  ORF type:complete len:131 (-),score=24.20 TRINITY_DN28529_c0_g1_i6:11-403(-)